MPQRLLTESEILTLYRQGSEEKAFRGLMECFKERVYWHIRRIVISHEDADDLVQNTFVKVWFGLKTFRDESRLYTWIYRVATNEALNFLQEKKRRTYGFNQEITPILENRLESSPYFDGDEAQRLLQKALLNLTERQRLVFNMKYYDDMKYQEIAEVLNVAEGTLKATYHTAVTKIETYIKTKEI